LRNLSGSARSAGIQPAKQALTVFMSAGWMPALRIKPQFDSTLWGKNSLLLFRIAYKSGFFKERKWLRMAH
jgi:hypothetical protein